MERNSPPTCGEIDGGKMMVYCPKLSKKTIFYLRLSVSSSELLPSDPTVSTTDKETSTEHPQSHPKRNGKAVKTVEFRQSRTAQAVC
jgi:hypothetical protein